MDQGKVEDRESGSDVAMFGGREKKWRRILILFIFGFLG
jgi:hypothetical protein